MPEVTDYTSLLMGQHISGLRASGTPAFYTFSFPDTAPIYSEFGMSPETFVAFTAAERSAARAAIAQWADASGLTVFEVSQSRGDIEFMHYKLSGNLSGTASSPGAGASFVGNPTVFLSPGLLASDVWIDVGVIATEQLLLHEIGHALGFKHPFSAFPAPYDKTLPASLDTTEHTIMSYTGALNGLKHLDLDAIAFLYGPSTADGTQVASWNWNATSETLTQNGFATAETIIGVAARDLINGAGGADRLLGQAGADTVYGGDGADTIYGGRGEDYLRGDEGDDHLLGNDDFDDINGNMGNDTAYGGLGDDWVVGGKDNDLLYGEAGFDIVYGNLGNDTLYGGDGNDWVRGGQADDLIDGGAGNDYMSGDRGNDTISGGSGADSFYFFAGANLDRVTDFNRSEGDFVRLEPGTTYTVTQVGADTVIAVTDGQMVLVGVQLTSLTGEWLTFF